MHSCLVSYAIKRFYEVLSLLLMHTTAMTEYCLVALIQQELKIGISTYEMLQKLSVTLTEKIPLRELFAKPKISNVKDQFDPDGQLLINF